MKKNIIILSALAMVMGLSSLTGCSGGQAAETISMETAEATEASTDPMSIAEVASIENEISPDGGTLVISVNPEIAIEYDRTGIVTGVTARNNEALAIINNCQGLIGSQTRDAVNQLVTAIGEAGYFVEDVSGQNRQITIEIEAGSALPYDGFMDEVVEEVKACVNANQWAAPLDVRNESDYGITNYIDTDYGPNNDGVTDYNDTDYGPNNDGVTDYNDTDYGPDNDGVTDYGVTDYAVPVPTQPQTQAPPATQPAPAPAPAPAHTDYGNSGYGGASDYSGASNYGNSGYGDSGYDD